VRYQELQNLSISELYDRLHHLKKSLLSVRMRRSAEPVQDTSQIRKNRRDIARIKTRLIQMNQKQSGEI